MEVDAIAEASVSTLADTAAAAIAAVATVLSAVDAPPPPYVPPNTTDAAGTAAVAAGAAAAGTTTATAMDTSPATPFHPTNPAAAAAAAAATAPEPSAAGTAAVESNSSSSSNNGSTVIGEGADAETATRIKAMEEALGAICTAGLSSPGGADGACGCIRLLAKSVANIIQNPTDPKYKSIKKTNKKYVEATARFPTAAKFLEHVGFETMEVDNVPRYVYVGSDRALLQMASDLLKSALELLGG